MIKLLTGNDLLTGDVVWWDGAGWSLHLRDAVPLGDEAPDLLARIVAGERINDPALIDAAEGFAGQPPRPRTTRERIRGLGPTVRPDLARA